MNIGFKGKLPENFPKSIDLSRSDNFKTDMTIIDHIEDAQKNRIPYYTLVGTKTGNNKYKFYDHQLFDRCHNSDLKSLIKPEKIENIYYFAIPLFRLDSTKICTEIDFKNENKPTNFHLLDVDKYSQIALKNLSNALDLSEEEAMRAKQYIIATHLEIASDTQENLDEKVKAIQDIQSLVLQLVSSEKILEERIKWLWCASKKSIEAKVKLIQDCLTNSNLATAAKALIKELPDNCEDLHTKNAIWKLKEKAIS